MPSTPSELRITQPKGRTTLCVDINTNAIPAVEREQESFVRTLAVIREDISEHLMAHRGEPDSNSIHNVFATFGQALDAANAALDIKQQIFSAAEFREMKVTFRLGIQFISSIHREGAIAEDERAQTSRIAKLARRDQILTNHAFAQELKNATECKFTAMPFGMQQLDPKPPAQSGNDTTLLTPDALPDTIISSPSITASATVRLFLRYQQISWVFGSEASPLRFGREPYNNFILHHQQCSRNHALLEMRGDHFFLRDTSTNGTYVTQGKNKEILLKKGSLRLEKKGIICFGSGNADASSIRLSFAVF